MSDDEKLAREYLTGRIIEGPDGKPQHQYLESGSEEEREAKAALGRLLRTDNLSSYIRWALAGMHDPESKLHSREFVIKNRSGGAQPNHVIDIAIAMDVAQAVDSGTKLEAAIQKAVERYGVSRSTAFRAWEDHGRVWLDRLRCQLKASI